MPFWRSGAMATMPGLQMGKLEHGDLVKHGFEPGVLTQSHAAVLTSIAGIRTRMHECTCLCLRYC